MGLDLLEFVMAVEDSFSISIPDEEATRLLTPRLLADWLEARLAPAPTATCLTERAFYVLRRAGMSTLDLPRRAFRPDTRWADLLGSGDTADRWATLRADTGVRSWPPEGPRWTSGPLDETVGDTASRLAAYSAASLIAPTEGWSRATIEDVISRLIRSEFGIDTFRWDDHFVRDLHVDH